MKFFGNKTIPAFRVDSVPEANAIGAYLKQNNLRDSFVVSTSRTLLRTAQAACTYTKCVFDAKNYLDNDLGTIREYANQAHSRVILLPASFAKQRSTAYLSALASTVWYKAEENTKAIRGKGGELSGPDSKVKVYVIPTNEELMIARDTKEIAEKL